MLYLQKIILSIISLISKLDFVVCDQPLTCSKKIKNVVFKMYMLLVKDHYLTLRSHNKQIEMKFYIQL